MLHRLLWLCLTFRKDDAEDYPEDMTALEEQVDIDEHAYSYQEIGDEKGIADELQAVHERRYVGNVSVEDEAGKESSEHALDAYYLGQGCTHEKHRHDEDELHDGITVAAQKPAGKTGNEEYHKTAIGCKLGGEEYPEEYAIMLSKRGNETC